MHGIVEYSAIGAFDLTLHSHSLLSQAFEKRLLLLVFIHVNQSRSEWKFNLKLVDLVK
jgi:hypothetical protein